MNNATPEMKRIMVDVAACMAALDGQDAAFGTPASNLYILLGMDMERWEKARSVMVNAGFITISDGHAAKLTDGGRKIAPKFREVLLS